MPRPSACRTRSKARRWCATWCRGPGSSLTEAAVIEHCRASLPAPKVPKQVVIVAELPKSDRGKVLRDKLKEDWNERMKLSA